MAMKYFMGVSALFHRIVPSSDMHAVLKAIGELHGHGPVATSIRN